MEEFEVYRVFTSACLSVDRSLRWRSAVCDTSLVVNHDSNYCPKCQLMSTERQSHTATEDSVIHVLEDMVWSWAGHIKTLASRQQSIKAIPLAQVNLQCRDSFVIQPTSFLNTYQEGASVPRMRRDMTPNEKPSMLEEGWIAPKTTLSPRLEEEIRVRASQMSASSWRGQGRMGKTGTGQVRESRLEELKVPQTCWDRQWPRRGRNPEV